MNKISYGSCGNNHYDLSDAVDNPSKKDGNNYERIIDNGIHLMIHSNNKENNINTKRN